MFAVVCLALAGKYFETRQLSVMDMHTYTNQSYTRAQFNQAQEQILLMFDFNLFGTCVSPVELLDVFLYICKVIIPQDRFETIRKTAILVLDQCLELPGIDSEVFIVSTIFVALVLLTQCTAQYPAIWRLCSMMKLHEYDIHQTSTAILANIINKHTMKAIHLN